MQGHENEELYMMAQSKLLKKGFHRYSNSSFLILVGCSLMSILGNAFQILGKWLKYNDRSAVVC